MWVAAALVIVLVVFGIVKLAGGGGDDPEPTADPTTTEPTEDPTSDEPTEDPTSDEPTDDGPAGPTDELALGDSATLDENWEVTVQEPNMDATQQVVDDGAVEPQDGNKYVMVYVTATNTSDQEMEAYPNIVMGYVNSNGDQFDGSTEVAPDDMYAQPVVAPGDSATGTWLFEVSEDSEGGYWLIQSNVEGSSNPPIVSYVNP